MTTSEVKRIASAEGFYWSPIGASFVAWRKYLKFRGYDMPFWRSFWSWADTNFWYLFGEFI